jgi:threonine synthase
MQMTYVSTRGEQAAAGYSSIVLRGLAKDGGLFMPASYPQVTPEMLSAWKSLSYAELAYEVLRLFADDIDKADLKALCERTYRSDVYCFGREDSDFTRITPVRWLSGKDAELGLLELSNGPTLAFKDMAMQFLGSLFEYLLARENRELNILGATSGDTGSAAEYAMRSRKGVRVFMLSPDGRMSAFQRAQMYTLDDPNIVNLAVVGAFDDAQDIVKAVSNDHAFKERYSIGTVNSINWARVAAQVVYYFKGWLTAAERVDEVVDMTVPSGNFGNILAGWIAKQMGLPIGRLVVATNENDVLDEFFKTGTYRVRDTAHTYVTSSPSMDISKASNFERYIFDIVGRDAERVRALWDDVARNGGFSLTDDEFDRVKASGFVSGRSTHEDRLVTIRDVWESHGVMIDPHTADGIKVARENKRPGIKMLTLETALPAKFAETIKAATGQEPTVPAAYQAMLDRPQRVRVVPAEVELVKSIIREAVGD